jgi:hypothetical protein
MVKMRTRRVQNNRRQQLPSLLFRPLPLEIRPLRLCQWPQLLL